MNVLSISQNIGLIILAFGIIFLARIISTYPILSIVSRFTREKIPSTWRHIVVLGGMRGALSVALVASLPAEDISEQSEKLDCYFNFRSSSPFVNHTIYWSYKIRQEGISYRGGIMRQS